MLAGVLPAILYSGSEGQHMFPGKSTRERDGRRGIAATKLRV
jgi:hypothetical protein